MNSWKVYLLVCVSLLFAQSLVAGEKEIRGNLGLSLPIQSVEHLPEMDLFQIELVDGTTLFSNESGTHFIVGALYSMDNNRPVNITERSRDAERVEAVNALNEEDLVIFPADGEAIGHIYVFTDIDCGYCRRLHSEMPIYNSSGIEVRYIAWPRCGVTNCESYEKSVAVWCADDRLAAMTEAKSGAIPAFKTCDNPVKAQYELGVKLGLQGTPFIVLDNGTTIPGYKPAAEIIQILKQS